MILGNSCPMEQQREHTLSVTVEIESFSNKELDIFMTFIVAISDRVLDHRPVLVNSKASITR